MSQKTSPQRRGGAEDSQRKAQSRFPLVFSLRLFSAPLRLCGNAVTGFAGLA